MIHTDSSFSFRPALLRGKRTYRIRQDYFNCPTNGRNNKQIPYAKIRGVRYSETVLQSHAFRSLQLSVTGQKPITISLTLAAETTVQDSQDLKSFYQFIRVLAQKIAISRPNIRFAIGPSSKTSWIYFSIGILAVLGALGILGGAYLSGVSEKKLLNALMPMLGLIGFGAFICYISKPWAGKLIVDHATFQNLLAELANGKTGVNENKA